MLSFGNSYIFIVKVLVKFNYNIEITALRLIYLHYVTKRVAGTLCNNIFSGRPLGVGLCRLMLKSIADSLDFHYKT